MSDHLLQEVLEIVHLPVAGLVLHGVRLVLVPGEKPLQYLARVVPAMQRQNVVPLAMGLEHRHVLVDDLRPVWQPRLREEGRQRYTTGKRLLEKSARMYSTGVNIFFFWKLYPNGRLRLKKFYP